MARRTLPGEFRASNPAKICARTSSAHMNRDIAEAVRCSVSPPLTRHAFISTLTHALLHRSGTDACAMRPTSSPCPPRRRHRAPHAPPPASSTFFATTEAATAISTVARTTTIAYVAIAVNASVKCSGMAIACSGRSARSNPNPKPQPRPKANPDRALTLPPTPTRPLTLALRLSTHSGPKPDHDPNHSTGLSVRCLDGGHDPLLRSTAVAHARRPGSGCLEPPSPRSSKSSSWTVRRSNCSCVYGCALAACRD